VRVGRCLLAGLLACAVGALGGCGGGSGGGSSTATAAERAHAFALAGVACGEYDRFLESLRLHEGEGNPNSELEQFLERTEQRGNQVRAALTPVEKLPGVPTYMTDLTTQVESETALLRELKKSPMAYLELAETKPFAEKTRRAGAAVGADAKALGLSSCVGPKPPRKPIKG
jgi:hypothetical protein